MDNGFPKDGRALAEVNTQSDGALVEVVDRTSGEPVYALRINGRTFTPRVKKPGIYVVRITEPGKQTIVQEE